MREHKYRGLTAVEYKDKDRQWVYGSRIDSVDSHSVYIGNIRHLSDCSTMASYHEVRPETVGEYTGLKDKNGREIYEGDLVIFKQNRNAIHEVFYHQGEARFKLGRTHYRNGQCGGYVPEITSDYLEVIGSIHENPDLLEAQP